MEFLGTFGCVWSSKEVIKVIIGRAVHGSDLTRARPRGRSPFTLRSDLTRAIPRGRSPFTLQSDLLERQGEVAPDPRATSPQRHLEVARVYVDLRETNKPRATSHSDHLRSLPPPRATSRSDVPKSLRVVYLVELMIYQGLFGHFVMHVFTLSKTMFKYFCKPEEADYLLS
ncbi:hypothetical protein F2Q70_00002369 [Brassica cretica]|uniref:Uncharacterized protein n=1 Tax=Brassica cretica TaxID=69181 RepID=A0A8S9ITJ8_BRACR|nr:hypothetical protein F2Q70_00002369 [Brassica cretica]